jgi:hypothetical protein
MGVFVQNVQNCLGKAGVSCYHIPYRKSETPIKILQSHSQVRHVENIAKDSKNHKDIAYRLIKPQ